MTIKYKKIESDILAIYHSRMMQGRVKDLPTRILQKYNLFYDKTIIYKFIFAEK